MTTDDGGSDTQIGGPPPVLLAALGAALLIAVGLVFAFSSLTGADDDTGSDPAAGAPRTDERVLLTVSVVGGGIGTVRLMPSGVSCSSSCEYKFKQDTRVTATVRAENGSTFEGWGDSCSGERGCSFRVDRPRILSATFAPRPASQPLCEGVAAEDRDPTCPPEEEPGTTTTEPVVPGPDCEDAIDNDDDGLTDSAQDPDCETSGNEGGTTDAPDTTPPPASTTPTPPPPPPPSVAPNECTDGRDNDDDGLTDREQDPDCERGRSESG